MSNKRTFNNIELVSIDDRYASLTRALGTGYGKVSGGGALKAANRGDDNGTLLRVVERHHDHPRRKIIDIHRDKSGLAIQPAHDDAERRRQENERRLYAANHFKYADKYTGNTRTWDPTGKYNCGRCNQVEGTDCLLLDIEWVHLERGSCGDWENICAGDFEPRHKYKNPKGAGYDIAVVGWGCPNCPWVERAYSVDDAGRSLYCRKFATRVDSTACCVINGAKTVPLNASSLPSDKTDKALVSVDKLTRRHADKERPKVVDRRSPRPLDGGGAVELSKGSDIVVIR